MRTILVMGATLLLAGCASMYNDAIKSGDVFCGTVVGMGYTGRVGTAKLDQGVVRSGQSGTIVCAPDGTLTISVTSPQPAAKTEPAKPVDKQ